MKKDGVAGRFTRGLCEKESSLFSDGFNGLSLKLHAGEIECFDLDPVLMTQEAADAAVC